MILFDYQRKEYDIMKYPNVSSIAENFPNTVDFIYRSCLDTIKTEQKKQKKKADEIYNDRFLVSHILNGKIDKRKNPYLFTPSFISEAKNNLRFNSITDMVFGNSEEMFRKMLRCYIEDLFTYDHDIYEAFEKCMIEYVPYAKYSTFKSIKEKYHISLLENYLIYDELVNECNMIKLSMEAIDFLLSQEAFVRQIRMLFDDFYNNETLFTKLDTKLEFFSKEKVLPFFVEYSSKPFIGRRIKELIENDLVYAKDLLEGDISDEKEKRYRRMMNRATSAYIVMLEDIFDAMSKNWLIGQAFAK